MIRIIIGAIIGFVVWSVLWIGSDAFFMAISTTYRQYFTAFNEAMANKQPFEVSTVILLLTLLKSVICSIIAGLIAVIISKEQTKTALIVGILLLAVGIFVQSMFWNYFPLWYHIPFLVLLVPMTILGGRLRKSAEVHNF